MKIFRKITLPVDFSDALLLSGAAVLIFGVYKLSHPVACIVGGMMAIYAALRMGS